MKQATVAMLLLSSFARAQETGIAAQYPGDEGIAADPRVVFAEGFEGTSLDDVLARWEYNTHAENMALVDDVAPGSVGSRALFFASGADLYQRLLPGYETLYLRFYTKLESECTRVHHWPWLGGHNPSTGWPWPRAGTRPVGDERFSTGVEPMDTHLAWDFYTYWMHMRTNPDTNYWGNTFSGRPSPYALVKNQWVCVEFMVKLNKPVDSFNGEQAFWIDGVKLVHLGQGFPNGDWVWDGFYPDANGTAFEGFQWRSVPELLINYVWLEHYVDTDPNCGAWFDDLVIATEYIGPISSGSTCIDNDNDGYGDPASSACAYASQDCDDNTASINPGVVEICDDGEDNDCDGRADAQDTEDCPALNLDASSNGDAQAGSDTTTNLDALSVGVDSNSDAARADDEAVISACDCRLAVSSQLGLPLMATVFALGWWRWRRRQ